MLQIELLLQPFQWLQQEPPIDQQQQMEPLAHLTFHQSPCPHDVEYTKRQSTLLHIRKWQVEQGRKDTASTEPKPAYTKPGSPHPAPPWWRPLPPLPPPAYQSPPPIPFHHLPPPSDPPPHRSKPPPSPPSLRRRMSTTRRRPRWSPPPPTALAS
ncbi:hypothetical protein V8G54_034895 [Vigna mungo]|uniref:Uncharacterized protein n=1 Tax=Vigna mungo TaxID=3915 RepID=A0AAQ3RCD6_VIGMU